MNLVAAFVRNPVKVAVGVLLLVLFGALAATRMPVQLTPEVITPKLTVETIWPGASPQEVEREIVEEQEEQLKSVEGVTKLSSECMDSMGRVILEFDASADMQEALVKVNSRLGQVRDYPDDAQEPILSSTSSADQPIGWFILRPRLPSDEDIEAFVRENPSLAEALAPALRTSSSGLRHQRLLTIGEAHPEIAPLLPTDIDMSLQRRFAENVVEARFERVDGISNSNVLGGREDEIQVVVAPRALAARGLTLTDVRRRLGEENVDTSGGDYWEGKRRYVVRTLGRFRSLSDVEDVVLLDGPAGKVRVRDVATVQRGYKKADGVVRSFGADVIAINCVRSAGANVIEAMEGIRVALAELNEGPLAREGLMLEQVSDETDYIESAIGLVQQNLLLGFGLTVLVLLLFLRSPRSTLVIALTIPTSIIGTFLILGLLGRSLNVISLAGLAFAIGMLVDNAVVVLENVYRHYQMGARRREAAIKGTQEVWGAVVASTLTTLAVFLPILTIEEEAGQLFKDIALAVSASVALSLLLSISLIPTVGARILPKDRERPPGPLARLGYAILTPFTVFGQGVVAGITGIQRFLAGGVLRQLVLASVLVGAAIWAGLELVPKVEYLPAGNRNLAIGLVFPPPGYNLDELVALGETAEKRLRPYWDVDDGESPEASADLPAIQHFFFVARGRSVFLGIRSRDPTEAGKLVPQIRAAVSGIPGTFAYATQTSLFEQGLGAGRTIDIEITGADLPTLVGVGAPMMFGQVAQLVPDAQVRPVPSLDLSNPEVHVVPRPERTRRVGVGAGELGYWVNSLVDGAFAGEYDLRGEKIDLTLLGSEDLASRFQDLASLPVAVPTGEVVPLGNLAEIRLRSGPEQIDRRERQRSITIRVSPPDTVPLEAAIETIDQNIVQPLMASVPQVDGGPAYEVRLSGTADKLEATWSSMRTNLLLALLITYLLLAALFESWLYPFIIILVVPLGAAGGLAGLKLLNQFENQPLDVLTMIGFIILIGTVVNNAILIVHQSLVHSRDQGMPAQEAITEAVRNRVRPIFMTTLTTVFGLMPLVISPGAGSELYRGLGSILLGGLIVSTLFTIFLVPTLLRLLFSLRSGMGRLFGSDAAEAQSP